MPSPEPVLHCRYRSDPLDRLTSHNLPDKPELQRFYCKSHLATEVEGTIGYSIVQHDDLLLAQQTVQNGEHESMLLATDLQRSVLQTIDADRQQNSPAYSPYGYRPAESGLTRLLAFIGERREPVTGHYLLGNGYRTFNPALMRFNSPDTLSPFGKGGLNPYVYCKGDPINYLDRNGKFALPNFLSKLLAQARKTLKIPDSTTFMKGPSKTFITDIKVTNASIIERRGTNFWWRVVEVRDHNNIVISSSSTNKFHNSISGHHDGQYFAYSATPSLKEQSYSKLSGLELNKLDNFALPSMENAHSLNSFAEYRNAYKRAPTNLSVARRHKFASTQTRNKIRNGDLFGVHPDYADRFQL
jgi:RHS repeat-associated protein